MWRNFSYGNGSGSSDKRKEPNTTTDENYPATVTNDHDRWSDDADDAPVVTDEDEEVVEATLVLEV